MSDVTHRLHIDWTRCDGRGLCHELLPEVLTADDWGYPLARPRGTGRDGSAPPVPHPVVPHARRAVADCPRLALQLVADPPAPGPARSVSGRGSVPG